MRQVKKLNALVGLFILASGSFGYSQEQSSCQISLRAERFNELEKALYQYNPSALVEKYFYSEAKDHFKLPVAKEGREIHPVIRTNRESVKISDRLNIELAMKDFGLTKLEAVELQALLRRFTKVPNDQQLLGAVELVKSGKTLSGVNLEKLKAAKFVVALDVDGTLLDQDSKTGFIEGVHAASFLVDGTDINNVALNPGAVKLILHARQLGASVILFSRNNDILIHTILEKIKIEGKPLHSLVDGVFTSSHMIVPSSDSYKPAYLSYSKIVRKDLNMLGVERILIVDDDPDYVLQKDKVRVVKTFSIERALDIRPYEKKDDNKETAKINDKSREKIKNYFLSMADEYRDLERQLDYLANKLDRFNDYLALMSPLGAEAISLLTNSNSDYFLEKHEAIRRHEAIEMLEANPEKVHEILAAKKKKEKPKKDDLGDWYGRIFRSDSEWYD